MSELKVTITRYLGDEPQPGLVECELVDAHGRKWMFVEKVPILSYDRLDAGLIYPRPGSISGEVIARRREASGREILVFDTTRPDGVESVDEMCRFEVAAEQIVA